MGMASKRYARTITGVSTGAAPALHPDTLVRTVANQTVSKPMGYKTLTSPLSQMWEPSRCAR